MPNSNTSNGGGRGRNQGKQNNPGNFANRPRTEVRTLAAAGGRSQGKHNNPGNFANRPKNEVKEAARRGGSNSRSGDNRS